VPIGKAKVVREGTDVSIVTLSLSVHHALDVAEKLEPEGISVEVLDLRSLVPLDRDAIMETVSKTRRLIVVDEDYQSFGVSGEVIATVAERKPGLLDYVARVCVPDVPIPYASGLEHTVLPGPARIEAAVREAVREESAS
jgi:pyruvate dehydrogenase E1 component beta subunit